MSDKTTKNVAIRIPLKLHRQLKMKLIDGGSMQQVAIMLLSEWAASESDDRHGTEGTFVHGEKPEEITLNGMDLSADEREFVTGLVEILRSGDDVLSEAIRQNIRAFSRVLEVIRGSSKAHPDTARIEQSSARSGSAAGTAPVPGHDDKPVRRTTTAVRRSTGEGQRSGGSGRAGGSNG